MRRLGMIMSALVAVAAFVAASQTVVTDSADGAGSDVRLEIRYDTGGKTLRSATLTCRSTGNRATGYLRERPVRRLCGFARELHDFLVDPPQHEVCTELWGGPDRARVTGRIADDGVDRRLARNDGCEIDNWDRAQPLLPKPKGAGTP